MPKMINQFAPSALYRTQIANISVRMQDLVVQTALHPLRKMTAFNIAKNNFHNAEDEAYLCCSVMDTATVENEERANNATSALMRIMLHFKKDASDLIQNEPNETIESRRF